MKTHLEGCCCLNPLVEGQEHECRCGCIQPPSAVEIDNEEVWELVDLALETMAIRCGPGWPFKLSRKSREALILSVCEKNKERLPLRIRDKLTFTPKAAGS